MMKRLLITGATGNVGAEVIRFLAKQKEELEVVAGVRDPTQARSRYPDWPVRWVAFDFEQPSTFSEALRGIDAVFLLRPPQISDIQTFFSPLVESLKAARVKEVVFLSVQGAERSSVIPHNQIERLIEEAGLDYIFLRPSYFMQNLTTTLLPDIRRREITLPAGRARFNWIDVENIGEVAAILLPQVQVYRNQKIELTGSENLHFQEATDILNQVVQRPIRYRSVNPFSFFWKKRREGLEPGYILVVLLLHFLPRLQPEPRISSFYETLTGKKPTTLLEFARREKAILDQEIT